MSAHPPARLGLVGWLTTTDHKRIGILYMTTSFLFFAVGGLLSLLMRAELTRPGIQFMEPDTYAQLFTMHGTAMVFLAVASFGIGLANYLVPLQIGAPDMAFPRLNALSYWLYLLGGLVVFSGFATQAASAGWTAYAPLSDVRWTPSGGMDLWIVGLVLTSFSGIAGAVNILATAFLMRAPGMTMWRLPVFTWTAIATSLIIIIAFPPLAAAFGMLLLDRQIGTAFFVGPGSAILYQHMFWFFGHPEVYVMALPFFGVISEIVPVFARRALFGYVGMVLSSLAISAISIGVWAHHMFTTGAVFNPFFSGASFLFAIPTGVKFFNWIGTIWGGSIVFSSPMLFSLGFMLNFLLGGITGVIVASPPIDFHVHDTYFIVAHMHYVLMGGSIFAIFAAIHFWFPKWTGTMLRESWSRITFVLIFIGFNTTFFPMHVLGLEGMTRRVVDYPDVPGWAGMNTLATFGTAVTTIGILLFIANVVVALRRRTPAPANPWGGFSLEWATASPPPEHNFHTIPPILDRHPALPPR